jgi:hypothetical protein
MSHEKLQQTEFRGAQFQVLSMRTDAMGDGIEHQAADFHLGLGGVRSGASQQRLMRDSSSRVKRLVM